VCRLSVELSSFGGDNSNIDSSATLNDEWELEQGDESETLV